MNAVCVVAHPDDCVIFAYSFIKHFSDLTWHIGYLTYQDTDARAQEFGEFWQKRSVTTSFLGFTDDYRDIAADQPSFDTNRARDAIHQLCCGADIVLTHDAEGDYGHPHHRFVHRCVKLLCHDHVITFAPPGQGTHHYVIDQPDYDSEELPLHHDVIKGFHRVRHENSYVMKPTTYHRIKHA